jgi:hypothetical protein
MKYTVTVDHSATGEGRTIIILYVLAESPENAIEKFKTLVYGGDYFYQGAIVVEGFDFDSELAQLFLTETIKEQLTDDSCNRYYQSMIHFNYS